MYKNKIVNVLILIFLFNNILECCTGIRLRAKDGTIVYARTLEFLQNLDSELLFIPRNYKFIGASPYKNVSGLQWKSKYAVLGANALSVNAFIDGINENGLAGGIFYFPGYAQYQNVERKKSNESIASWQLLTWILTTCSTIKEVKEKLVKIKVAATPIAGKVQPVHCIIHDSYSNSIVIEYIKGKLKIYDNPLGVITNSPGFEWHITNLRNYIGLSAINTSKVNIANISFSPFGQGSGMFGLPGDFTPPSRFVRAAMFSEFVDTPGNGQDAIDSAFHILNLFDIPKGIVRTKNYEFDYTRWTSAMNLSTKQYFFHTYSNRQIYMVDLTKLKDSKKKIIIPMQYKSRIVDLTPQNNGQL